MGEKGRVGVRANALKRHQKRRFGKAPDFNGGQGRRPIFFEKTVSTVVIG
jgi:hypothetical protein